MQIKENGSQEETNREKEEIERFAEKSRELKYSMLRISNSNIINHCMKVKVIDLACPLLNQVKPHLMIKNFFLICFGGEASDWGLGMNLCWLYP